jgi:SHS2 domain-containing protein
MQNDKQKTWEHFEHVADIGVRGFGETLEQAFENAAVGLIAVITDPENVRMIEEIKIECRESNIELLFVDWLNAILFEISTRHMLFKRFQVNIEGDLLIAKCWGEKTDVPRHAPTVEIKAATYTALKIGRTDDNRWFAQCVVDV